MKSLKIRKPHIFTGITGAASVTLFTSVVEILKQSRDLTDMQPDKLFTVVYLALQL